MRKREAPIKSGEASSFPLRFGRNGTAPFDRLSACPREGGGRTAVDASRPFVHSSKIKGDRSNRPPLCPAAPVGESRSPPRAASTLPLPRLWPCKNHWSAGNRKNDGRENK